MSRYYNDYLQHSDEDTLAHFGIPGMKWGQGHIHDRKDLAIAAAGGAIVGGLIGAYTGNRIKDVQRENQENLPYVD